MAVNLSEDVISNNELTSGGIEDLTDELINKRRRTYESSDGEWSEIGRNLKRKHRERNTQQENEIKIQICITYKDKLPKRFEFAKIMKNCEIEGIVRVRYVNPFKILLNFSKEEYADKLIHKTEIKQLEWKIQKTWEVGTSYGLIRDVESNLTEEEILENIVSDVQVVSARRLNRKEDDGSWVTSEKVRIGFIGPRVPSFVYLHHLRTEVERFVFPVTQCSRCWRFGHIVKMCPSNKIRCPKCGDDHPNCETDKFQCINCSGDHISLDKTCPVYEREKKIRYLMSEFNCSYQKALTLYVPPSPPPPPRPSRQLNYTRDRSQFSRNDLSVASTSYAQVVATNNVTRDQQTTLVNNPNTSQNKKKKKKTKTKKKIQIGLDKEDFMEITMSGTELESEETPDETESNKGPNDKTKFKQSGCKEYFNDLLARLKTVIFDSNRSEDTFESRIKGVFISIFQWFMDIFKDVVTKIPILKDLVPFFSHNG